MKDHPGLEDSAIAAWEQTNKVLLPDFIREFYKDQNGGDWNRLNMESEDAEPDSCSFSLTPLEHVESITDLLGDLAEENLEEATLEEELTAQDLNQLFTFGTIDGEETLLVNLGQPDYPLYSHCDGEFGEYDIDAVTLFGRLLS